MVDTHAHLDMRAFNNDRGEVTARALDAGVGTIITVGTNLNSSKRAIEIAEKHPEVLAAVGFHPHDATAVDKAAIATLGEIARHPRVVAIGELGLDFYRDYSPREAQLQAMKWQLELAAKLELPVIIHCRQAERVMIDLLCDWVSLYKGPHGQCTGVIHCFNGHNDNARRYLDMGFCLSLGAYIGYPGAASTYDVIRSIPEDRLLIETDCPFLPPQSHRGKRNEPSYLPLTIELLAKIKGKPSEEVARKTTGNALRLFHIAKNAGKGSFRGVLR